MDERAAQGGRRKRFLKTSVRAAAEWCIRLPASAPKWNQAGSFTLSFYCEFSFAIGGISNYWRRTEPKFILTLARWERELLLMTLVKKWVCRHKWENLFFTGNQHLAFNCILFFTRTLTDNRENSTLVTNTVPPDWLALHKTTSFWLPAESDGLIWCLV